MGENSKIEWTDETFNPWWGCEKVSPGCANCYAEAWAKRTGNAVWGHGVPRRFFGNKHWREPVRWNEEALGECPHCGIRQKAGWRGAVSTACQWCKGPRMLRPTRRRVFCASMADWLEDREDLTPHLVKLLGVINATPNLDWLLLTKRPQNFRKRMEAALEPAAWPGRSRYIKEWLLDGIPPHNVWIGTTVEDQQRAEERIPELLGIPARVRFLSCEPLLGPVDLDGPIAIGPANGRWDSPSDPDTWLDGIHWVIAGGESGHKARPMHPEWVRSLRDQCAAAQVPFFFKQWGEWVEPLEEREDIGPDETKELTDVAMSGKRGNSLSLSPDEFRDSAMMARVGKKLAGRLLDGREWSEFPAVEMEGGV